MSKISDIPKYYTLLFLLITVMFISYIYYKKSYNPLELTKGQYEAYTGTGSEILSSGESPVLPEGIPSGDLIYAKRLGICPIGYCVIDRKIGIKRCPEENETLTYNIYLEACVEKDYCNFDRLPYAVNLDGSTNSSGKCDHDGCRCINKELCPTKNLTAFLVQVSEFNVFQKNSYSYTIKQIDGGEENSSQIGYDNIEINPKLGDRCSIVPSQTEYLLKKCDFSNNETDPIECFNTDNLQGFSNDDSRDLDIGEIKIATPDSIEIEIGEEIEIEIGINNIITLLGNSGLLSTIDNNYTISYSSKFSKDNNRIKISNFIVYNDTEIVESVKYGLLIGKKVKILSIKQECEDSGNVNYKNMLMCVQEKNSVCDKGSLTYNYTREENVGGVIPEDFSRRFCQQEHIGVSRYLNSPIDNTVSCTAGPGCNGYFLELDSADYDREKNGDPEDRYFPDFDIGGVKNILFGKFNKTTLYSQIKGEYEIKDFSIYQGDDIVSYPEEYLDKGDCWSMANLDTDVFVTCGTSTGISIPVDNIYFFDSIVDTVNIDNIKVIFGTCIGFSYSFDTVNPVWYDTEINQGYINIEEPGLSSGVSNGDEVRTLNSDGGVITLGLGGIVTKEITDRIIREFVDFNREPQPDGNDIVYNFYKQFGFNGFNYNTTIQKISVVDFNYERKNKKGYPTPYTDITDITDIGISSQISSLYSNSPFRKDFSVYYPVWNPVLFREECVRCKPFLLSYASLINDKTLKNIYIQYSGKDFLNYEYHYGTSSFHNTSLSELRTDIKSTTKKIYLKEPNLKLKTGLYVLDSRLQFGVSIGSTLEPLLGDPFINDFEGEELKIIDLMKKYGINESTHTRISYEKILGESGCSVINRNGEYELSGDAKSRENYFFGKLYSTEKSENQEKDGFYFIPTVKIESLQDNNKTIITDSKNSKFLVQDETYLQFCDLDTPLGITVEGTKDIARVEKLSEGRITNIEVYGNWDNTVGDVSTLMPKIEITNYQI